MKPLYVIIHTGEISLTTETLQHDVKRELDRVRAEEDYIEVGESTSRIPDNITVTRPLKVCGAYIEWCVWNMNQTFLRGF